MNNLKRIVSFLVILVFCVSAIVPSYAENKYNIGDVVIYGSYEQDNNTTNGKEPIEWRVLDVQKNQVLLITRYVIDHKVYNEKSTDRTYKGSQIRSWLNGSFYKNSFSSEEQKSIIETTVDNSSSQGNSRFNPQSQADTKDKVFLLSCAEAEAYFEDSDDRECEATTYAKSQSNKGDRTSDWWLRSPGKQSYESSYVNLGSIGVSGHDSQWLEHGIRPAIWVKTTAPLKIDPSIKTPTGPALQSNGSIKVWVTDNGNKYHRDPSCSGMKNPYQITVDQALSRGLTACDKC